MEWLTTATTTCTTLFTTTLEMITTNPVLAVLFAGGTMIPLGIGLFHKFKGAAH